MKIIEFEQKLLDISNRKRPHVASPTQDPRRKEIFSIFEDYLLSQWGLSVCIASIRSRRGFKQTFLRPVFTKPERAVEKFEDPSLTGDFDFVRAAFGDGNTSAIATSRNQHEWIARHYSAQVSSEQDDAQAKRFGPRIAQFIASVRNDNESYSEIAQEDIDNLEKFGSCFVFARTEKPETVRQGSDKISDLIAIYSAQNLLEHENDKKIQNFLSVVARDSRRTAAKREIGAALEFLISTLENLERKDLEQLNAEVFDLIVNEIPEFAKPTSEPSFLIHNLTGAVQKICNYNPLTGSTLMGRADVRISYISLDFVENRSQQEIMPRLNIFPAFDPDVASISIRFSHPYSRSICKHLIGKWIFDHDESMQTLPFGAPQTPTLASSFREAFDPTLPKLLKAKQIGDEQPETANSQCKEDREIQDSIKYFSPRLALNSGQDTKKDWTIGIYATACREFVKHTQEGNFDLATKTFWGSHNFPVLGASGEKIGRGRAFASENHTTLAFLLTAEIPGGPEASGDENVPFGIVAFESPQLDAFSDAEIKIFGAISKAMSKLLTLLNFGTTRVDYSSKIRMAMSGSGDIDDKITYDDFVYEITRIKSLVLEEYCKKAPSPSVKQTLNVFGISDQETAVNGVNSELSQPALYRAFGPLFQSSADRKGELSGTLPSDETAYDVRQKWLYDSQAFFENRWLRKTDTSSTTENLKFARELIHFLEALPSNSIWKARLNTVPRALRHRKVTNPRLERFHGGFSADSVFVLDEKQELKQVLKFSQKTKIDKEIEAYQKLVRFKIPLAARISWDGFAIDSFDESGADGHGVIVSDLIATDTNDTATRDLLDVIFAVLRKYSTDQIGGHEKDHFGDASSIEINKIKKSYISAIYHNFYLNTKLWQSNRVTSTPEVLDFLPAYLRSPLDSDNQSRSALKKSLDYSARLLRESDSPSAATEAPDYIRLKTPPDEAKSSLPQIFSIFDQIFESTIPEFDIVRGKVNNWVKLSRKPYAYSDFMGEQCSDITNVVNNVLNCVQDSPVGGEKELHLEIVHGDLNPNNLLWSEAIQRFWLIDFEHVKLGYSGTDHLKLLFSTLVGISGRLFQSRGTNNAPVPLPEVVAKNLYFTIMQLCDLGETFKSHSGSRVDVNRRALQSWLTSKAGTSAENARDHFVTRIVKVLVASHFGVPMNIEQLGGPDLSLNESFSDYSGATSHWFRSFTVDEFRDKSSLFAQALPRFAVRELCYQLNEVAQMRAARVLEVTRSAGYDGSNIRPLHEFYKELLKSHASGDRVEKGSYKSTIQLATSYFALKSVLANQE
ncbi:MAG: hypothetical protein AAF092_03605 [Pseudomonadota bacterium]